MNADRRIVLVLTIAFSVAFLFLFQPFKGTGCDNVFYFACLSSLTFDA